MSVGQPRFVHKPLARRWPAELGGQATAILTESGIAPASLGSLGLQAPTTLELEETRGKGLTSLCSAIGVSFGLDPDNIIVTTGASAGVFTVQSALLGVHDHLVITRPNYPSNINGPKAGGCAISYVDLTMADGWRASRERIAAAMRPNTKLISVTNPNNPTGTSMTNDELIALADLASEHGCFLLIDETYAQLLHGGSIIRAASLGAHVIGVSSMSKSFGVSGLRIGWISTSNFELQTLFLAARKVINLGPGILDEELAAQLLHSDARPLAVTVADLRQRCEMVDAWIQTEEGLEWVKPAAGCIGFVHIKEVPPGGTAAFYERLMMQHRVLVAEGSCFGQSDTYFRLGFGYPPLDSLKCGLEAISRALRA